MSDIHRIAFIGLGNMGLPMALNLAKAGHPVTAFDLSAFMSQDSLIGTLLSSVFGYQDAPTVGEVIVYFAYLIPALILFFSPQRVRLQSLVCDS